MKSSRTFFVLMAVVVGFFVLGKSASAETVIWHVNEEHINISTTWHSGEIHVISDYSAFYIDPNASLTIEPGVIVKVGYNGVIRVYGSLIATGTSDSMIKIVSLRDDSVSGDTNGDGLSTSAKVDDWRGIQADGSRYNSTVNIDWNYVEIKHGGRGIPRGVLINATRVNSLKLSNCNIIDSLGGIVIDYYSKNIAVNNSNIYNPNFCDYTNASALCRWDSGLKSYSPLAIDVRNNYWGSAVGPTYTTGTDPVEFNGTILLNLMGANLNYLPVATKPFEFELKKRHPVILMPGFLGSWPDSLSDGWVMDPILHTYDDLLSALRLAGYEDNKTLFTLPYDWAKSNVETAQLLQDKINYIKSICVNSDTYDCSKVDLIGHSMGGLVARQYIESDAYQNDVDQLIFIATPHRGVPKNYLLWEGGDIDLDFLYNLIYRSFFEGKAVIEGYSSRPFYDGLMYYVREQVHSLAEVLPIYNYIRDASSGIMRSYPDNYPINSYLENLNLPANLAKLNQVKITNILGDAGNSTIKAFRVIPPLLYSLDGKWQHGIPENYNNYFSDRGLELGSGDDTVPKESNSSFNGIADTVIPNASHLAIVSLAQKEIIKELTGQEPKQLITSTIIDHLIIFQIFSPADFQVMAPDGQIIGRDMNSNSTLNEVNNGYYTGFKNSSTPEMVIISNPIAGDYQIKLIGTESGGSYKMSVSSMNDATSSESSYMGVIMPEQQQEINLNYLATSSVVSALNPAITIKSAIHDVEMLYEQRLLISKNDRKKIIEEYESLSHSQEKRHKKDKDNEGNKLKEEFRDFDKYLKKLVTKGVLKQLGYDIIKSNNDYLINNLQ